MESLFGNVINEEVPVDEKQSTIIENENKCIEHQKTDSLATIRDTCAGAVFLDLSTATADELQNLDILFKLKDHSQSYMGGKMISFSNKCFIVTRPTCQYTKVINKFNKAEDNILLLDSDLCTTFNSLTEYMQKTVVATGVQVNGHYCEGQQCYIKLSQNIAVYDKLKNPVPYSSAIWMPELHHEAKFLIQVYGAYLYENGGRDKVKIVAKIVQMQLFDLGEPFNTTQNALVNTCLL